jgi:hypothetical protein
VKNTERIREDLSGWPSPEYLKEKGDAGWRLVAVEWERESERATVTEEIPFGMRVALDCRHLEENPSEMQILQLFAEMVVQDFSFPRMAEALNARALRTRDGSPWSPVTLFKLSPRLVEIAPRVLSGEEWQNRKKQMPPVAWNS